MVEKSFRKRVQEEVPHFKAIYASYVAAHNARLETFLADEEAMKTSVGGNLNPWIHAFDVPFESSVKTYVQQHPDEKKDFEPFSRHEAVFETIHKLGFHELHLGAIYSHDPRINLALDIGLLTMDDMAPLYTLPEEDQLPLQMGPVARSKAARDDPFFWRALLEIFCRAYIASGGPRPWSLKSKIDLAFDLDDIRRSLDDGKWNKEKVLKVLRDEPRYKTKYPPAGSTGRAGIGEDRVKEITDLIGGPMDDGALGLLKEKFPELFFEVSDERWAKQQGPKDLNEIKNVLEEADRIGDAIVKSQRSADNPPPVSP